MKFFLLFILLFNQLAIKCQEADPIKIRTGHIEQFLTDFYIAEVEDQRLNQKYIGNIKTGLSNYKRPAVLADSFNVVIKKMTDDLIEYNSLKRPVKMIVHNLWISEKTTVFSEKGTAEVTAEFLRISDGQYISEGVYSSSITKGAIDVTKKLGRLISSAFHDCIRQYTLGRKGEQLSGMTRLNFMGGYPESLKVGSYKSFNDLIQNNVNEVAVSIEIEKQNEVVSKYKIYNAKQKLIKDYAYYTGDDLLINTYLLYNESIYFTKPKTSGRYLVYQHIGSDAGAIAAAGILGAVISNKRRITVLDTFTGFLGEIDEEYLQNILRPYEDLRSMVQNEKFNSEKIIEVISIINQRIKDSLK